MKLERSMVVIYCIFSAGMAAFSLYCIWLTYHVGPFRDMWIAMDFIRAYFDGYAGISDFFSLHGGAHRLAIPRLLFLIEYGTFSGSNIFLIIISLLCQFGMVWLIWTQLQKENHIAVHYRWFLTAMTLLLMFNATQLENFVYTFDMQWFLTSMTAVLALHFWNRIFQKLSIHNKINSSDFSIAFLAAFVSLYSSFSGLCMLLVLPVLAFAHEVPKRYLIIVFLLVAGVAVLYTSGPFAEGGRWGEDNQQITFLEYIHFLLVTAVVWIKWIALYFGSPLGRVSFWSGAFFSYTSIFFLVWQWIEMMRKGARSFTPLQMTCLSAALFALIVGVSTGLGRMYFVNTADVNRYQSIVAVYWLGIFGFALSRALQIEIQQKQSIFKYLVLAVIILWTGLVIPIAALKDARTQVNFFNRVNNVNLAIITGQWDYNEIKDTLILGDKWKKINRPEKHAVFLREKKWGVFAGAEGLLLGTTLDQNLISADNCEGGVEMIAEVNAPYHGYRITGYGWDVQHEKLLKSYVAIDAAGRVVGLGRLQRQKDSFKPVTWQPVEQAHWLLYTQNLAGTASLRVLGELDNGGYCVVASAKLPSRNS